jgi:hypothetical protein
VKLLLHSLKSFYRRDVIMDAEPSS